ncbi:MAG: amidohydrolase family protein, partial [Steroidobacteraceae bacterium]
FLHQRDLDNRSLHAQGDWPAKTQHSTLTRDAIHWATMGGAKAFRLDHKIGSITPGKQADLILIDGGSPNIFPALPGGNPAHTAVMYAETSDIRHVMVAGRFVKKDGELTFDKRRHAELNQQLLESRLRMFAEGKYRCEPVQQGPQPARWAL